MSERDKVISAGSLVMISYGLSQLIRLGANLIVTRLLAPEMFGVMAMVTVLMHGITMFSDVGLTDYVIRHKDYKNSHVLNAVWTIQVIRGWLVFILLIGLSFMMSLWQTKYAASSGVYGDESLPIMIGVVSISAIFSGYNSLAPAVLTRELKRGRLELIRLLAQTSGAVTMIGWAYLYPTIWALASAGVVSSAVTLLLSYTMFNFRHRLEWNRERVLDVFNFGKWIFIASAITYLAQQGDKTLVNLASNEYFKAVKKKNLKGEIITPAFKDWKNGQFKMISFFAKKARGLMARYIIQNQLTDVEQLKNFDLAGYEFNADFSQGNEWVFTRKLDV